jgi:ribonuclease VapC
MVIDSSVIVAIALLEESWRELSLKASAGQAIAAAPTLLEAHMMLTSRLGDDSVRALDAVILGLKIEVVAFGAEHFRAAAEAFDRFGKGRHPAALNFGDCISYALSKVSGQPLLFVGEDFSQTDVAQA